MVRHTEFSGAEITERGATPLSEVSHRNTQFYVSIVISQRRDWAFVHTRHSLSPPYAGVGERRDQTAGEVIFI